MKRFLSILAIGAMLTSLSFNKAEAQSTSVTQPFALLDSSLFSLKPYIAQPSTYRYYMVKDSLAIAQGWTSLNYYNDAARDTVRFARTRGLMIQIINTAPVGSFQMIVHKDSTGTINAAKVYLQASNDGVTWTTLNDTMSCTNITVNSHMWVLPSPNKAVGGGTSTSDYKDNPYEALPYLFYRLWYVGVATAKADIHAFFIPRHRSTSPN